MAALDYEDVTCRLPWTVAELQQEDKSKEKSKLKKKSKSFKKEKLRSMKDLLT